MFCRFYNPLGPSYKSIQWLNTSLLRSSVIKLDDGFIAFALTIWLGRLDYIYLYFYTKSKGF